MQQSLDPTRKGNSLFAEVQLFHRYPKIYKGEKKYFLSLFLLGGCFFFLYYIENIQVFVPDLASRNL